MCTQTIQFPIQGGTEQGAGLANIDGSRWCMVVKRGRGGGGSGGGGGGFSRGGGGGGGG